MSYRVEITKKALRSLRKLPKPLVARLLDAAEALADNPRPGGCVKLRGFDDLYRIRVGDWRIVYAIEDDVLLVLVITIKPRGEVYRDL
jgi:mRNA interferase RelE/StbE